MDEDEASRLHSPQDGPAQPAPVEALSKRELQILGLIARGFANREIGVQLQITEGTVKVHVQHIFGKLTARNRTEAVAIGRARRIID